MEWSVAISWQLRGLHSTLCFLKLTLRGIYGKAVCVGVAAALVSHDLNSFYPIYMYMYEQIYVQ